jgi:hypothetical protein
MGGLMTLPLYGTTLLSSGFRAETARSVVRLRLVECSSERHASDFALVKTPEDVQRALECNWRSVFAVSDSSIASLAPKAFEGRLIAVPPKYDYLGDGDVLGFDHSSRKLHTLFRRNSAHNSLSGHGMSMTSGY